MASRTSFIMRGDPRHGYMYGDPGLFGFLGKGLKFLGRAAGVVPQETRLAITGGGVLSKTAGIVRAHPGAAAAVGGLAAAGAGAALEHAARGGGMMRGGGGGFEILTSTRSGRPRQILVGGKVITVGRRRKGISAAAISGAFRLARLAHMFAGVARTGRRTHARKR